MTAPLPDLYTEDREHHVSDYLQVLYKRKAFILMFFGVFVIAVAYLTLTTTKLFEASVELVIEPKSLQSPITGKPLEYETFASQILDMGTHFRLIQSKPVVRAAILRTGMDRLPEKKTRPGLAALIFEKLAAIKERVTGLFPDDSKDGPKQTLDPATQKLDRLIRQVQKRMDVSEIKKTRLVKISVRNPDPLLAARLADGLAESYISYNLTKRLTSSSRNLDWLNTELSRLKKELEGNERAFYAYKSQHKVFSLEGKQKATGQKIQEFNSRYLEAKNTRMDLDSKINEIQRHRNSPKGLLKVSSLIHNDLIEEIYNKIGDLEVELSKLSKFYKAKHPKIIQVKSEIEKNNRRLDFELEKELATLKAERTMVADREKALEKTVSEFEQDALDASANELTYSILQRKVETSQRLYDLLMARIKESDIIQGNAESNISLVAAAAIPRRPVHPRPLRNLLFGAIFGLCGGCLLAFFFEYMDQTLNTKEEVQSYLRVPVLAVIPESDT